MPDLRLWTCVLVSCGAVVVGGCGDDYPEVVGGAGGEGVGGVGGAGGVLTGGSAATGGSAGGSGGQGGSTATAPFEVTVTDFDGSAIEGAGVAVDLANDTRVEGLTDALGVVTLALPADVDADVVIAHKDGHSFVSIPIPLFGGSNAVGLGIGADPDTSSMIAVTGTASNMADPVNDRLIVVATPGTAFNEVGSTSYDVLVEANTDFTLMAFDLEAQFAGKDFLRTFHSNVVSSQTGVAAPVGIAVDFANPTALAGNFALSVTAPADASLVATGSLGIDVGSPTGPRGASTSCTHDAANGEFDCVGELWDSGAAADATSYSVAEQSVHEGGFGRSVFAQVAGGPASGLVSPNFPNPPDVIAPMGAGPHPVDTVVEYTVAAGGGAYDFVISNIFTEDRLVGVAFADQMGELRVPALPSSSNAAAHYEASMTINFFTCAEGPGNQCIAVGSETWEVSPPAN